MVFPGRVCPRATGAVVVYHETVCPRATGAVVVYHETVCPGAVVVSSGPSVQGLQVLWWSP